MPRTKRIPIESVLTELISPGVIDPNRASVLCDLIAWMQSPDDGGYQQFLSRLLKVRYFAECVEDEHSAAALIAIVKQTKLRFVVDGHMTDAFSIKQANHPLEEEKREYVSQTVRFVVSYVPENLGSRTAAPSLGKALFALNEGIYGKRWDKPETWADDAWREYKVSAPFIAADRLGSHSSFAVNPADHDLAHKIRRPLSEASIMLRFLGQAKWLQTRLRETLYPVAFSGARPVHFPEGLQGIAIPFARTTDREKRLMRPYRAGSF